mmetsp:Transcript_518/g.1943  ORF Transcript_518/g.1943 Transcript_518/m.1943 type:complete len:550 (+) Transcript_518:227-1876(+)
MAREGSRGGVPIDARAPRADPGRRRARRREDRGRDRRETRHGAGRRGDHGGIRRRHRRPRRARRRRPRRRPGARQGPADRLRLAHALAARAGDPRVESHQVPPAHGHHGQPATDVRPQGRPRPRRRRAERRVQGPNAVPLVRAPQRARALPPPRARLWEKRPGGHRGPRQARRTRGRGRRVRPVPLLPVPGHVQGGGHRVYALQLRHRPVDARRPRRKARRRRRHLRRGSQHRERVLGRRRVRPPGVTPRAGDQRGAGGVRGGVHGGGARGRRRGSGSRRIAVERAGEGRRRRVRRRRRGHLARSQGCRPGCRRAWPAASTRGGVQAAPRAAARVGGSRRRAGRGERRRGTRRARRGALRAAGVAEDHGTDARDDQVHRHRRRLAARGRGGGGWTAVEEQGVGVSDQRTRGGARAGVSSAAGRARGQLSAANRRGRIPIPRRPQLRAGGRRGKGLRRGARRRADSELLVLLPRRDDVAPRGEGGQIRDTHLGHAEPDVVVRLGARPELQGSFRESPRHRPAPGVGRRRARRSVRQEAQLHVQISRHGRV